MAIKVNSITRYRTTTTTTATPVSPSDQTKQRTPRVACKHFGSLVGHAVCGCQGSPVIHVCNHASHRFCSTKSMPKDVVDVFSEAGLLVEKSVPSKEITVCGPGVCADFEEANL